MHGHPKVKLVNYLLPHTHKPTGKDGVLCELQCVIIHNSEDKKPRTFTKE